MSDERKIWVRAAASCYLKAKMLQLKYMTL